MGTSVAISGDTLVVGAPLEDGSGSGVNPASNNALTDSGAAYVYVRNGGGWTLQAYLKASNPGSGDRFGESVAISGNTIVVGAKYEDGGGSGINPPSDESLTDSGAAYVFTRSGGVWSQQAYVKASSPWLQDYFGAVAVSGDTLAVGARMHGVLVNNSYYDDIGAAYVFVRNANTWSEQAYLTASNAESGDLFGNSVALAGDTLVVGAPDEDGSGTGANPASDEATTRAGAAYVFTRSGTMWSQQAYLKASNTGEFDQFGGTVAVDGDTVVVGATGEDGGGAGVNPASDETATLAGAAYVFTRAGSAWSQQAYLKATNSAPSKVFGCAVAIYSNTLVVGGSGDAFLTTGVNPPPGTSTSGVGAAYVFLRSGSTWTPDTYLKPVQANVDDHFGNAVAVFGSRVVIGATGEDGDGNGANPAVDESATNAGSAEVFSGIPAPEIALTQNGTDLPDGSVFAFGNVLQGANAVRTFTVSNTGDAGLTLHGDPRVVVTGPDAAMFTVTAQPAASVASGGSTTFVVLFSGTTGGLRNAMITLANDDADESAIRIQVTANVLPPDIAVSQNGQDIPNGGSHALAGAAVGFSSTTTFTITNPGAATLNLTGAPRVALSGPDAAVFSISSQPAEFVTNTGSTTFGVMFTPVDGQLKHALVTISNNDGDESPFQFEITAQVPPPLMEVIQPHDNGEFVDFGGALTTGSNDLTFVINNSGGVALHLTGTPAVSISGPDAALFTVLAPPTQTTIPPYGSTEVVVRFAPGSAGPKLATLTIQSNDPRLSEAPYARAMKGTGLTFADDTDGDGLNDGSELQMAALGFDWHASQPGMVNTLFGNANQAGLYTQTQIRTLNAGAPLLEKDPVTGMFKLTLGLEKSTDLGGFAAFPMTAPQCVITADGRLEFTFSSADSTAFFRIGAQ